LRGQPAFPTGPTGGGGTSPLFVGLQTIAYIDKDMRAPYTQHFNLNVQRQLGRDTMVQAGYVGMLARKLIVGLSDNPAVFGPGATLANINARRILPGYGANRRIASSANAAYHALQLEATKRYSRSFSVQGSYTFSRSIDVSSGLTTGDVIPQPFNLAAERGLANFHAAHLASASWIWDLPLLHGRAAPLRWALGSWQFNGLLAVQSGSPVNILLGSDVALSGTPNQRPNVVGEWRLPDDRSTAERIAAWFNRAAFAAPPTGTYGNAGRNIVIGPGSSSLNLGMMGYLLDSGSPKM
jgi:hypothetical protein